MANGYLCAVASGYIGDAPPYDGHVVGVRLAVGHHRVWNSLCSNDRKLPTPTSCQYSDSGIWSRGGAVVDPDSVMNGEVYLATGNGQFDAGSGGDDYGYSVIGLTAGPLAVVSSYTPADYEQLDRNDEDLGSTSPALLPRQEGSATPLMLVQGGKDQTLRLLDRNPLPGIGGELQEISLPWRLFATPAVWIDRGRRLSLNHRRTRPQHVGERVALHRGQHRRRRDLGSRQQRHRLRRLRQRHRGTQRHQRQRVVDQRHGQRRETIGPVHWESPIVVNGRVYCSDENGNLTAYACRSARCFSGDRR